jgi:hypothetical protein
VVERRLHQLAADASALGRGIDRDQPDALDRITLIEEDRAEEAPLVFSDDRVDGGEADEEPGDVGGVLL